MKRDIEILTANSGDWLVVQEVTTPDEQPRILFEGHSIGVYEMGQVLVKLGCEVFYRYLTDEQLEQEDY